MEQEGAYEDELYGTAYRIKVYPYDIDEAAGAVEIYGDYGKAVWYLNEETGWLGYQYISPTGQPDGTGISILWPYETPPDFDTIQADEREYQSLFEEFIRSVGE